jgi:hypothetical protein
MMLAELIKAVAKYETGWICTRAGRTSRNEVLVVEVNVEQGTVNL